MLKEIDDGSIAISIKEFHGTLKESDSYSGASDGRRSYIDGSADRLYRVFRNMVRSEIDFCGPTLDVASGWGILYPALREYYPKMMPYHVAEMGGEKLTYDGVKIPLLKFECEKDRLDATNNAYGTILFLDIIEHLIVDPLWPLLEFNRTLKKGGHIVINTPNAAGFFRVKNILEGESPATENTIRPSSIYQRHNREWTINDIKRALECCGFECIAYTTNVECYGQDVASLLDTCNDLLKQKRFDYGPEIFLVGRKVESISLDDNLPMDIRWPDWLYTAFDAYRKRPKRFPINVGDDYG